VFMPINILNVAEFKTLKFSVLLCENSLLNAIVDEWDVSVNYCGRNIGT
jgi:hypothetical protein